MLNRRVNPVIAEAILSARILHLSTAREAADYHLGGLEDMTWAEIAMVWEWHFSLSSLELRRAAARL